MDAAIPYYRTLNTGLAPVDVVANAGISGLAAVGNAIDLPASSVRDVLALRNPLDQWATPFSGANRTSGRDLLRNVGVIGKEDTWANFVPGLALEVALDPLLLATFGGSAMGRVGQQVRNVGLLENAKEIGRLQGMGPAMTRRTVTPQMMADVTQRDLTSGLTGEMADISKAYAQRFPEYEKLMGRLGQAQQASGLGDDFWGTPLGGDIGLGRPFSQPRRTVNIPGYAQAADTLGAFVTGSRPVRLPSQLLDKLPTPVKSFLDRDYSNPAGPPLRSLFDNTVRDSGLRKMFPFAAQGSRMANEAVADAKREVGELFQRMIDVPGVDAIPIRDIRHALDTKDYSGLPPELHPILDTAHDQLENMLDEAKVAGLQAKELQDELSYYFPRQANREGVPFEEGMFTNHPLIDLLDKTISTRRMTRFARSIENMLMSPDILGHVTRNPDAAAKKFDKLRSSGQTMSLGDAWSSGRREYRKNIAGGTETINAIYQHPEFLQAIKTGDVDEVVNWLDTNPLGQQVADITLSNGRRQREEFAQAAMNASRKEVKQGPTVSIRQMLMDLGLDATEDSQLVQRLAETYQANPPRPVKGAYTPRKVLDTQISVDIYNDAVQQIKGFKNPAPVGALVKFWDAAQNYFKFGVTAWPNFHTRNALSGTVMNALKGQLDMASLWDTARMLRGDQTKSLAQIPAIAQRWRERGMGPAKLTEKEAANILRELEFEHDLIKGQGDMWVRSGGQTAGTTATEGLDQIREQFVGGPRGENPFRWSKVGGMLAGQEGKALSNKWFGTSFTEDPGTSWKNWMGGIRGVGEDVVRNPISAASDQVGEAVETINRRAPFISLLRQGLDPAEAARRVKQAQVDYSPGAKTSFERNVMTRAFPFYSFTRGITPVVFEDLAERPGGPLAQTIRATSALSDSENPGTPEHIAQTAAIPLGQLDDGTNRYLSGLGLMHEDPLSFIGADPFANPGKFAQNLGLEIASRSNPIIKGFIEGATGESLFQRGPFGGRELDSLDPGIGRTLSNISRGLGLTNSEEPVRYPGASIIEPLVSNSPLSKVVSTARQITDPRKDVLTKGINLTTGIRVTDVSPVASLYAEKNRIQELLKLRGGNTFSNLYFRPNQLQSMGPEERQLHDALIGRLTSIQNRLGELRNQVP